MFGLFQFIIWNCSNFSVFPQKVFVYVKFLLTTDFPQYFLGLKEGTYNFDNIQLFLIKTTVTLEHIVTFVN
jgi:hypothetical protein